MPELPEVQTVVNSLKPLLIGRRLRSVAHVRADMVCPADITFERLIPGKTVESIDRRGKRIVFSLSDGNRWFIHLGMTGQLTVEPQSAPTRPHTHLIINCERGWQLRFVDPRRFGGIFWLGRSRGDDGMGPEPFGLRVTQLLHRLSGTRRYIKTTLLDQRFIAGIGNIYADEALFAAGIHPLTMTQQITPLEARRLNLAIKRVLTAAIRHRGSSLKDYVDANGNRGSFKLRHKVYGREGLPCRECAAPIARIVVAQRSTHYCPTCQPVLPE